MFVYWRVNSLSNTECLNLWLWISMGIPWSKMKLWESRFDPVDLWEKKVHQIRSRRSSLPQYVSISLNFKPPTPHRIDYAYLYLVNFSWVSCQVNVGIGPSDSQHETPQILRWWDLRLRRMKARSFPLKKFRFNVKFGGWKFATLDFCFDFFVFAWDLKGEIDLRQMEGGPPGPSKICCECADFQMLFQLDDFKSVKKDGWFIFLLRESLQVHQTQVFFRLLLRPTDAMVLLISDDSSTCAMVVPWSMVIQWTPTLQVTSMLLCFEFST